MTQLKSYIYYVNIVTIICWGYTYNQLILNNFSIINQRIKPRSMMAKMEAFSICCQYVWPSLVPLNTQSRLSIVTKYFSNLLLFISSIYTFKTYNCKIYIYNFGISINSEIIKQGHIGFKFFEAFRVTIYMFAYTFFFST